MNGNTPNKKEVESKLNIFGKNIKYLREARGLSLEALSSQTNISIRVLRAMENGADFEAKFLVYLCDFYDVSSSALFSASFIRDSFD